MASLWWELHLWIPKNDIRYTRFNWIAVSLQINKKRRYSYTNRLHWMYEHQIKMHSPRCQMYRVTVAVFKMCTKIQEASCKSMAPNIARTNSCKVWVTQQIFAKNINSEFEWLCFYFTKRCMVFNNNHQYCLIRVVKWLYIMMYQVWHIAYGNMSYVFLYLAQSSAPCHDNHPHGPCIYNISALISK